MSERSDWGIAPASLQTILAVLRSFPDIERAVLFGSRAMGNYKNGSDIDLALLGPRISAETISAVSRILNEEAPIPYRVDLVGYDLCENEELAKHIRERGKPFFSAS